MMPKASIDRDGKNAVSVCFLFSLFLDKRDVLV